MSINEPKVIELNRKEVKCAGFQRLTKWQVNRYQQVVDEQRISLSKETGRVVDWRSAEKSFCDAGKCETHARQWRSEFCTLICPERSSCPLAQQYFQMPAARVREA
jgi:hypothetical protein